MATTERFMYEARGVDLGAGAALVNETLVAFV